MKKLALAMSGLFLASSMAFAVEPVKGTVKVGSLPKEESIQYRFKFKTVKDSTVKSSFELTSLALSPSPFEISRNKELPDCVWTHENVFEKVEITTKNTQKSGVSGTILALNEVNGTVKTMISFSQSDSVDDGEPVVINDTCSIQAQYNQTTSFSTVRNLKFDTPTTIKLSNGDDFIIEVSKNDFSSK